jgi:arabinose-5-phosphate isomerase
MTLSSTGTRSIFLNPTDALYGDIGLLGRDDFLVLFSKSGATEELVNLIPFAKAKGAKLFAISSSKQSKLAQLCERHIFLPLERELCPFDLAPVTSTAIQMIFGDTCAAAIMRARSFSPEDFALNHPSGRMGKRLVLNVSDVMIRRTELAVCGSHDELQSVILELSSKGFGCLLVLSENFTLTGVFSDGDLRRKLSDYGPAALKMRMGDLVRCPIYFYVSPIQPELTFVSFLLDRFHINPELRQTT